MLDEPTNWHDEGLAKNPPDALGDRDMSKDMITNAKKQSTLLIDALQY